MKKTTKKQLKNKLWKLVSKYVRTIEESCYTCEKWLPYKDRSAGHYWTKKGHPRTHFDLVNVHTQCTTCNNFKSGNLDPYSSRLIRDYGLETFQELERRAKNSIPLSREELEAQIELITSLINNL